MNTDLELQAAQTRKSATPVIVVTTKEKEVADEAIRALSRNNMVFTRAGTLVRIFRERGSKLAGLTREIGAPLIVPVPLPALREILTECADWVRVRNTKNNVTHIPIHPPDWAVKAIDARSDWGGIPFLEAVVEAPIIRPDGTILQTPGYDAKTGLFYEPNVEFPLIGKINKSDINRALESFLEVVCDFPFSQDYHRSAWLSGVLTPFARFAFSGPSPLFLVDGNIQASGKGKLADCAGIIFSGRPIGRMSQSANEEEEGKKITSIAYQGDSLVLIDNINRPFGNAALDAALTTNVWQGRLLGTNKMPTLHLFTQWWATGNNVQFAKGTDTSRRVLHIRLDSPEENPETRTDLKHPELIRWVKHNRPKLAVAAVTLLAGYIQSGKKDLVSTHWGSFTGWSRLIRNCVVWAGLPDPFLAYEQMKMEEDSEKNVLGEFLTGWEELCKEQTRESCTVREMLNLLEEDRRLKEENSNKPRYERLYNALLELVPAKPGRLPDALTVGNFLRKYRNRVVNGRRLERIGEKTNKGQLLTVRRVDKIVAYGKKSRS